MEKKIDPHCPGDDPTRRSAPEEYACPGCGAEVEIWSDEKKAACYKCGIIVMKDKAKRTA